MVEFGVLLRKQQLLQHRVDFPNWLLQDHPHEPRRPQLHRGACEASDTVDHYGSEGGICCALDDQLFVVSVDRLSPAPLGIFFADLGGRGNSNCVDCIGNTLHDIEEVSFGVMRGPQLD